MLTFTSTGGPSLRIAGAEKVMLAFPKDGAGAAKDGALLLLAVPEEEPSPGILSWPGEYNHSGITIRGIGHNEGQQVSYVVDADDLRVALLSSPLQDWTDPQIESVGEIDVLVLPADDAKIAHKLIDEFDPRVLILTLTGKESEAVLKSIGGTAQRLSEYKLKGQLPAEGREVVVMEK
ncbi:hypothetical protein HY213_05710 [Candidatus Peregrinibacteria bacterium]|nr:hypothetical protein [Candidatus Peregrinibacteria bacterium]